MIHAGIERADALRSLPPCGAGPSHMDFLESLPGLGTVWPVVAAAAPQNRIRNRPESKREQLLRTFDAFRTRHLTAPRFFPYAIPLPLWGRAGVGGSSVTQSINRPPPCPSPHKAG